MRGMDEQDKQRATRVEEVRPGVWLYSDGSQRNERGQALALPPKLAAHAITSANARDMLKLREEKRMRLYAEGAQLAVQNIGLVKQYGTDAHIVERAMTLQQIASTPDAGKAAVMADTALQRAQGYDVKGDNTVNHVHTLELTPEMIDALAQIRGHQLDAGDVIDADET